MGLVERKRRGVPLTEEQAAARKERRLAANKAWYAANKDKVRLANGGAPAGKPAPEGAGRPRGTPNKRTLHARFVLEELGADPAGFLALAMKDEANPLDVRIDCAKALMPYVFPKLSAVQVSGVGEDGAIRVEHEHALVMRMMRNPELVRNLEDLVIEQAEDERRERGLLPAYMPELPAAEAVAA